MSPVRGTTLLSAERLDIEHDLGQIFAFNPGGDVVVDAEFVGVGEDLQRVSAWQNSSSRR